MAKQTDHKNEFNADDLRRYHTGQMSPGERHALEKAALDDPFLSDALEGYAFTTTHESDLAHIRHTLSGKKDRRKVVPLFFRGPALLKGAAVFLLLAGAGIFLLKKTDPPHDLASNNEAQVKKNNEVQASVTDSATTDTFTHEPTKKEEDPASNENGSAEGPATARANPVKHQRTANQKDNPPIVYRETHDGSVAASGNRKLEKAIKRKDSMAVASAPATPEIRIRSVNPGISASNAPAGAANYFTGRVVDANFNALPYATVVTDKKEIIQTDVHGNFTIAGRDSVMEATVTALGYTSSRRQLNTSNQNTIVLQQNQTALDETVVVSKAKQRIAGRQHVVIDTLEPAGGWRRFDEYIARNITLPEAVERKDLSGEVLLSFEINSKGEPVNITVEKSLCTKCDEEAIRLLKAGPKWKTNKDRKGRLTIKF